MNSIKLHSPALKVNSSYFILLLLCFGSLFIKNPKFLGIAIADIAIVLGLIKAFTYEIPKKTKFINLVIVGFIILFIVYEGIGIFKVPEKALFVKYYARVLKSFVVGWLGYIFCIRLSPELRYKVLKFFFYLAIVSIISDTLYSLYYYSTTAAGVNIWALYSALKVSYLYADKNMVAFTISLLLILSNSFFNKKYIFLLWFLTIVSLSRSGILINTLLLFYFIGFKLLKPRVAILLLITLALSIVLVYALDLEHMFVERLSLNKDMSMKSRLGLQLMGINMWLDAPLSGQGLSGFEQSFYTYYEGGEENPFPHNLYIYILSEQGLIGLLMLTIIFSFIWFRLYKIRLGMIVGTYLMFGMFLFNLSEYQFFFLVGLLLAYNSNSSKLENSIFPSVSSE